MPKETATKLKPSKLEKMEYSISKDDILKASKQGKAQKQILETLFPKAFEDKEPFIKIGSVMVSAKHPHNNYALVKISDQIKILNVSFGTYWAEKEGFRVYNLTDPNGLTLTFSEFDRLTSGRGHDFTVLR